MRNGKVDWGAVGPKLAPVKSEPVSEFKTYSVEETAKMCGFGRTQAYKLVASGELPTISFGKLKRVPHVGLVQKYQEAMK
jgi:excisionase family DNA binding protein